MIARIPSHVNMHDRINSLSEEFDRSRISHVAEKCHDLNLDNDKLKRVMDRLEQSFVEGLQTETAVGAAVKMLPSYVRATSVGREKGKYLALDLGGSRFRVLIIELNGKDTTIKQRTFEFPESCKTGTGAALFDHVAACLAQFMDEQQMEPQTKMPLGFTFSFPCKQEGLTSATLMGWTKGFSASGVVGENVVRLLREACQRKGVNIDVCALINDTVGTMLACSFFEPNCSIGLIVGTGSNACYMEKLGKIPKLRGIIDPAKDELPDEMCINCEWGAFGDDGKLEQFRTKYDKALDGQSIQPGKQLFEKMISGMYLGELVRHILEDLAKEGLITVKPPLRDTFTTRLVSEIERQILEGEKPLSRIREMLQGIGIQNPSNTDCAVIAHVCALVSSRSAHLCAAGIAALLKRMDRPSVSIGVDGTVYKAHPTFKDLMAVKISQLVDGKYKFKLVLSEDGSGRGAAVAAAIASRNSSDDAGDERAIEGCTMM